MSSRALNRLRDASKIAAHHLGVLAVLRRLRRRERSIILRYHAVASDETPVPTYAGPEITIPRALFAAQMRFLRRAYTPVPLATIADAVGRGEAPPAGTVAITLDDGYADNYHQAFPVLRALGLPATVYVVTETLDGGAALWMAELRAVMMASHAAILRVEIGGGYEFPLGDDMERQRSLKELTNVLVPVDAALRRRILATIRNELAANGNADVSNTMLSSIQIREMHAAGITIGAHTQTHSNMTLVSAEQARTEIGGSRERLEALLGVPVRDFAYPNTGGSYPHCNESVAAIIRQLGFRSAVTSRPGIIAATSNPYLLPRIGVAPRLYREAALAVVLERYRLFGEASA
ncbi:MAG: polysaccharide deacetylase family protein [Deltaproteobacteria bacterium]|nr:polysaccharide deacetylase family protein [Deltaproteobacteria bacterium]